MRPGAGLSRFEFAVVLVVFGVLAHLLFARLVALEHETERLEVELTVRHINVGLKLAIGERLMRGEEANIPRLLLHNPLDFLERNGQKVGSGATAQPGDGWNFDATTRVLAYHPRQLEAFGQAELRWRLAGQTDELGRITGLRLEALK